MSKLPLNQILCGNCVEVLKDFSNNSIDLVVTDPPYGLSFMGKDWDKTLPPREAFEEIVRVLKPGALSFVMSSPRQDLLWRMLSMLEGVGFELTQSYIDWIYKTGFPKAYDVSKGIDKKFNLEREIISKHPNPNQTGWVTKYKAGEQEVNITAPKSELSKKWDGWKSQTGLKPAHEPILMVNKPFSEKTIVDNILLWDTGAINVDACRIPFQSEEDLEIIKNKANKDLEKFVNRPSNFDKYGGGKGLQQHYIGKFGEAKGRFPANLLVSDKAIDTGKKTGAGVTGSGVITQKNRGEWLPHNVYGDRKVIHENIPYMDVGDQSRYFDLDAWAKHHGFLDVPKPDNSERDFGLKGKKNVPKSKFNLNDGSKDMRFDGIVPTPRRNVHPTVKPIKLMAYLIELGCPPNGVVLDPFVGSGTTCIAAKQLVRKFIGIEVDPKYHALAKARVDAYPIPLSWFSGSETSDVLVPPRGGQNEATE